MGLFSSSKDERTKAEREADLKHYKALRRAAEQAARNHRDEHMVHHQINEAVVEAEKNVSWWRR